VAGRGLKESVGSRWIGTDRARADGLKVAVPAIAAALLRDKRPAVGDVGLFELVVVDAVLAGDRGTLRVASSLAGQLQDYARDDSTSGSAVAGRLQGLGSLADLAELLLRVELRDSLP
jgi:ATP phosphoribosyltransferase regulatory subunit HisZ